MGSKSETESETRLSPELREQALWGLDQGRDIYNTMNRMPSPDMYVGISPDRQFALDQIRATAMGGSGVPQSALGEFNKTMQGAYLSQDANPYINEIMQRAGSAAGAAPVSGFAGAGRFGSGAMANAVADALVSTRANIGGQNYQQERNRMMQMAGLAPQMNELQYADAMRLGQVGDQYEADQHARNAELMRQRMSPMQEYNMFLQTLSGNPLVAESNMQSTTTTMDPMAAISGIAGGAMSMMGPCYVAAEYYGWFTPDWWNARDWIVEGWQGDEAEEFREVYLKDGPEMAERVRNDPAYSSTMRPLFDWARDMGKEMKGEE
jgi:hypothetical protein